MANQGFTRGFARSKLNLCQDCHRTAPSKDHLALLSNLVIKSPEPTLPEDSTLGVSDLREKMKAVKILLELYAKHNSQAIFAMVNSTTASNGWEFFSSFDLEVLPGKGDSHSGPIKLVAVDQITGMVSVSDVLSERRVFRLPLARIFRPGKETSTAQAEAQRQQAEAARQQVLASNAKSSLSAKEANQSLSLAAAQKTESRLAAKEMVVDAPKKKLSEAKGKYSESIEWYTEKTESLKKEARDRDKNAREMINTAQRQARTLEKDFNSKLETAKEEIHVVKQKLKRVMLRLPKANKPEVAALVCLFHSL